MNDRLVPVEQPDAYLEVLNPHPRAGLIKVFDAAKGEDRYEKVDAILAGLHSNQLTLSREGLPQFSLTVQGDDAGLLASIRLLDATLRDIHAIQADLGVSFRQAYQRAKADHEERGEAPTLPFPPLSTMYRHLSRDRAGLPLLRGDKNKGNRNPRYSPDVDNLICVEAREHYLKPQSKWTL